LTDQTDRVDSNSLPNDKFGFRIYGVMAHLPEPQVSQTRKFHTLIGADDLATKPHCSIDNFWGPDDLDAIKTALGDVTAVHQPFETSIDFDNLRVDSFGCAYELKPDDDHFALQAAVQAAIVPLTKRLRPASEPYWPHTTMVLDVKPEERLLMEANLEKVDMTGVMRFESIELIGRVGPSRGGEYQILASFPLLG
jgi:2'-5' RNA ligase